MNYCSFLTTFQYSLTAGILGVKYRAFILPGSTWSVLGGVGHRLDCESFSIKLATFVPRQRTGSDETANLWNFVLESNVLKLQPSFQVFILAKRRLCGRSDVPAYFAHAHYNCLYSLLSRGMSYAQAHGFCACPLTKCHRTGNYHTGMYTPSLSPISVNEDVVWRRTGKTFPFWVAANVALVSRNQSESF